MIINDKDWCRVCDSESTYLVILVYEDRVPICEKCIRFIKKSKWKDLRSSLNGAENGDCANVK